MVTTIHDLPPEILQLIFRTYVTSTFAKPKNWNNIRSPLQNQLLRYLSLVCKAWNALVSLSPELWAHVHTNWRRETLEHHFALSSNARLHIYVPSAPQRGTARMIAELSERVESVHFWSENASSINNLAQSWRQTSFPHLTKLQVAFDPKLVCKPRSNSVEINFAAWIQSSCPALSFLELDWPNYFNFTSLPLSIQFLSLHSRRLDPHAYGSIQPDDFFRSLTPLHALHTLELSGEYISTVLSPNCPSYSLELPKLEVLHLSQAYIGAIERLLATINSPPLVDLKINGYLPSKLMGQSEQVIDTIHRICQPIEGALKVSLGTKEFSVEWVRNWLDGGPPTTVSIHFRLAADCIGLSSLSETVYRKFLVRVWRALTSENLLQVEAKISENCVFSSDDWLNTFELASLNALEEIEVEDERQPSSTLTALAKTDMSEDGVEQALFPNLKRLRLRHFHFELRRMVLAFGDDPLPEQQQIAPAFGDDPLPEQQRAPTFGDDRAPAYRFSFHIKGEQVQRPRVSPAIRYTTSTSRQFLQSMLTSRRNLGFGIEELTLEKCFGLDADWISEVKPLVKKLNVI
ncbi:hypothetical protein DL96DRAFT_488323 [Flagelloscypha sp. PMI_526]|nr:hypothetical protein DL96DRAFT_488323 [Flagelloscypha sp. PMI_526]